MRTWVGFLMRVVVVVSVGCGRVGFDAHQASRDAGVDATPSLDAGGGTMDAFASDTTIADSNVAVNDGPTVVDAPPPIDAGTDAGPVEACANGADDDGDSLVDLDDGDCACTQAPPLMLGVDDTSTIDIASCGGGLVAVAWKQSTGESGIHFGVVNIVRGELSLREYLGASSASEQDPRVACTDTHLAIATTVNAATHALHVFDRTSESLSSHPFVTLPMAGDIIPRVRRAPDGTNFGVAWWDQRSGNRGIYFRTFDTAAMAFGPETLVSNNTAFPSRPTLVTTPAGYVVAWMSGAGGTVRERALDATGAPIGADFDIQPSGGGSPFDEPFLTLSAAGFRAGWAVFPDEYRGISFDPIARTRGTMTTITTIQPNVTQIGTFRRWVLAATTGSATPFALERYDAAESATLPFLSGEPSTSALSPRFVETPVGLAIAHVHYEGGATETQRPAVTLVTCPP